MNLRVRFSWFSRNKILFSPRKDFHPVSLVDWRPRTTGFGDGVQRCARERAAVPSVSVVGAGVEYGGSALRRCFGRFRRVM